MPKNVTTNRPYSGVNVVILRSTARERGFSSQRWLTYRQALTIGSHIRKGERGTTIVHADHFVTKGFARTRPGRRRKPSHF